MRDQNIQLNVESLISVFNQIDGMRVCQRPFITPRELVVRRGKEIAGRYIIEYQEMFTRTKRHDYVHARWEFMVWLRAEMRWSLKKIGAFFGCDHTTVLHGIRKYERLPASLP